jgi:hypothetical protein
MAAGHAGFQRHAVSYSKMLDRRTDFHDGSGGFVSEYERRLDDIITDSARFIVMQV